MYVDRMDLSAGLGGTRGLEDVARELGSKRRGAGGFIGQTVLRSYAYPDKFTVLGRWESVEQAWGFGANDVLTPLITGKTGPAKVDLTRFEGFEAVIETGETPPAVDGASFEQFADWTLSSISKAADYLQSRRELFALQQTHNPGFVAARLYRSAGIPTKFLMHTIFRDRAAAQAGGSTPELREFVASHPAPNYASVSPSIEAYAVIHRL
jgi:heme-degrading monooxygenase HmoA